jgi:DNA-binding NtrC family response regulator
MNNEKIILIIDDEPIILQSLKIQLERLVSSDYYIEPASSGEEAFELLDEFHSNKKNLVMVISDYNLDAIKGTEVLAKTAQLFPNASKVILSGQMDLSEIEKFKSSYKLDLQMGKPWDINEIFELINNQIE